MESPAPSPIIFQGRLDPSINKPLAIAENILA